MRLLRKFPPRHLVAEIYVVAYPSVRCFFDGKSNRLSPPLALKEGNTKLVGHAHIL